MSFSTTLYRLLSTGHEIVPTCRKVVDLDIKHQNKQMAFHIQKYGLKSYMKCDYCKSKFFARIVFSQIAFKCIFVALKIHDSNMIYLHQ